MIIFEFKLKGKQSQYKAINDAIRTTQFVRNKCIRYWIDNKGVGKYDLNNYCKILAREFSFAEKLNSMARQSAAERAWSSISRFYDNCKKKVKGKKGYPQFKKNCRSVEYKTCGWKLSNNRKRITFTDKNNIGTLKLKGTYNLNFYQLEQIKRVKIVKRADGYYAQFSVSINVETELSPTFNTVGLDLGLKYFLADSNGKVEESPQFYRSSERQLKRANRKKSKKFDKKRKEDKKPQSNRYIKARNSYARKHLRVSRQRKEYCKRLAYSVIQSNDLVAYEDLKVKNMVRNRRLAKSISDAGWYTFRTWLEHFGRKYGKIIIAVPPHNTSQNCSNCGKKVQKTLSTRTHVCPHCKYIEDRDVNAAINILKLGLSTAGRAGIYAQGDLPSSSVGENLLDYGESLN